MNSGGGWLQIAGALTLLYSVTRMEFYTMNLGLIAVTTDGIKVAERIKEKLNGEVTVFLTQKLKQSKLTGTCFSEKLVDQMGENFSDYAATIKELESVPFVKLWMRPYKSRHELHGLTRRL